MRRTEYARDDAWIRGFLAEVEAGCLATLGRDGRPHATPMNFWYDSERHRIVLHGSPAGQLAEDLAVEPQAGFSLFRSGRMLPSNDAEAFTTQYESVFVQGRVTLLADEEQKRAALDGLIRRYWPRLRAGRDYRPMSAELLARTAVWVLEVASWSGKRNWKEEAEQNPDWPPLDPDRLAPTS
jgi:nitroimidazol reductase NimA-like FMN-containing flavoprotein (pyridoxamine 5'-phosphate oxidase superfamily)